MVFKKVVLPWLYNHLISVIGVIGKMTMTIKLLSSSSGEGDMEGSFSRPGHFTRIRRPEPEPTRKYRFGSGSRSMLSTYWVFFFGPAGLGSGPGPTRDPFGYPKYPQIIVYTRYIWVIEYIFGISDFF